MPRAHAQRALGRPRNGPASASLNEVASPKRTEQRGRLSYCNSSAKIATALWRDSGISIRQDCDPAALGVGYRTVRQVRQVTLPGIKNKRFMKNIARCSKTIISTMPPRPPSPPPAP
eukprot:754206-Prymnesium_polylepis.1